MEISTREGDEPDCRLDIAALLLIAWYRSLNEMERAVVDLFVTSFTAEVGDQRLKRGDIESAFNSIQQRPLLAA